MKTNYLRIFVFFTTICYIGFSISSCGDPNAFDSLTTRTSKEQAAKDINRGNYNDAINELTRYLQLIPNDYEARSMLACAYMLRGEVNMLNLAYNIANLESDTTNDFNAILQALPSPTAGHIDDIQNAINTLTEIPSASRTQEQNFQLAIANAAWGVLLIKQNCLDESNHLTLPNVQALSDSLAENFYSAMTQTYNSLIASGTDLNSTGAGILSDQITQINESSGTNIASRVKSFLESKI